MISIDLVQSKRDITYQIYDWHSKTLGEWKRLETRGIVIIEGVYSTRSELRDSYDVRVFVSTPDDLRQERMTARNQNSTVWREKWLASEAYYKQHESPSEFAHFVLVGGVVEQESESSPTSKFYEHFSEIQRASSPRPIKPK